MTRLRGAALGLTSALLVAGFAGVAASSADTASPAGAVIALRLSEWKLEPAQAAVRAGRVSFVVRNDGTMAHELLVLRSDRHHHRLTVIGGRAIEKGRVGRLPGIPAGASKRITLRLAPGTYILLCNLLGHYQAGQYAALRAR